MTIETFFTNFGHLADAPNGVQKLRELILQLAVQGKLGKTSLHPKEINPVMFQFMGLMVS